MLYPLSYGAIRGVMHPQERHGLPHLCGMRAPREIRTPNPQVKSLVLCTIELAALGADETGSCAYGPGC